MPTVTNQHRLGASRRAARRPLSATAGGYYSADMHEPEQPDWPEPDGDPELIVPAAFLPADPFPVDARRMGIDRWSDDAGMIAIAASLDPGKVSHKIVAWLMLLAITLPLVLNLWWELGPS